MVKFAIGVLVGTVLTLIVHAKLENKAEAQLNHTVSSSVDTASSAALDGMQSGLNKANGALKDARNGKK